MTDAAVVRLVLAGDPDAFAILVDRYYDRYARYAVHMLGNREDAEEALQDAFLRAYRALAQYEDRERFGAWLYRILVNQCRTVAAQRRRRTLAFPDLDTGSIHGIVTAERADDESARERLEALLAHLPRDQREAIVLKYTEDLTFDEMAEVTGVKVSALKMRVKRALERLRRLVSEAPYVVL